MTARMGFECPRWLSDGEPMMPRGLAESKRPARRPSSDSGAFAKAKHWWSIVAPRQPQAGTRAQSLVHRDTLASLQVHRVLMRETARSRGTLVFAATTSWMLYRVGGGSAESLRHPGERKG